jgi:branched-chain amino acid transport system permease protein
MLFQLLVDGFALGSFYVLVALGFAIIFGVTHAFNLAHGELIVLSGYLAYLISRHTPYPLLLALPSCVIALMLGTWLLRKLVNRIAEPFELNSLVITFGLSLVLQNLMLAAFSADYRIVVSGPSALRLAGLDVVLTGTQIWLVGLSLLVATALYLLLNRTFLGKALRATIQGSEAARLAGIQPGRMRAVAYGLGGALIGLAGPLYARTAYLHPYAGIEATLTAIVVTLVAGAMSIRTILLGGWLLGLTETLCSYLFGSSWRELVSALVLLTLLIVRPRLAQTATAKPCP